VFVTLPDGVVACAPTLYGSSGEYYLDSGCTDVAYTKALQGVCEPMDYLLSYVAGCDSGSGYHFYEVGDAVAAPGQVYQLQNGVCTAVPASSDGLFRRGPAIGSDRFMSATYGPLADAGRVRAMGYSTSDGVRQVRRWIDTELDSECSINLATDGERRCLPDYFASGLDVSTDAMCQTGLYKPTSSNHCDDALPNYVASIASDTCPPGAWEVFSVGAPYDGPVYGKVAGGGQSAGGCTELGDDQGYVAAPAPLSSFEKVDTRTDDTFPGRLKPQFVTTPDGGCWYDDLWDSELGVHCEFDTAADGQERCLPGMRAPVVHAYSDEGCTNEVTYAGPLPCGTTSVPPYVQERGGMACDTGLAVSKTELTFHVDESRTVWTKVGISCTQSALVSGDYAVLTLMEPSSFVAGEVVGD
jgi:hypothetical protein